MPNDETENTAAPEASAEPAPEQTEYFFPQYGKTVRAATQEEAEAKVAASLPASPENV